MDFQIKSKSYFIVGANREKFRIKADYELSD